MILKLLLGLVKAKLEAALDKAQDGGTVTLKGLAHGVKLRGRKYSLDVVARPERENPTL